MKNFYGFSMIELIFVIIIVGILASVSLPKLINVTEQSYEIKIKSYVNVLNKDISGVLWSKSLNDKRKGDISYLDINKYIEVPTKLVGDINLSKCNSSNTYKEISNNSIGNMEIKILCKNGTENHRPVFKYEIIKK